MPQKRKKKSNWLVFFVAWTWIFLGFPPIWKNANIPKTQAAILFERSNNPTEATSSVMINISAAWLDDLMAGNFNPHGLPPLILEDMNWWGIAAYDYDGTETFVSNCVPVSEDLSNFSFNLGPGQYVTEISIAATKKDCQNFNQNSYPLYLADDAAKFTIE